MVLQGNRAYLVRMDLIWLTAKLKKRLLLFLWGNVEVLNFTYHFSGTL